MKNINDIDHRSLVFSDEAIFHLSEHVNGHYCVFPATENPHVIHEHEREIIFISKCVITESGIIGLYFLIMIW